MSARNVIAALWITGLLAAGCARAPFAPPAPTSTTGPRPLEPLILASPTAQPNESTPTEIATGTSAPFILDLTALPTETPLATVEVPTVLARPPAQQVWDGLPTYLAESNPNYYFRVLFDPQAWALTTNNYGSPALVHRAITNCTLSPTGARDLPPNAVVDQETRRINGISYQVNTVSVNGVRQTVTYTAGDGRIFTAFQLSLDDRPDQCIQEAELVLGTLTSVPVSSATPIATP